MGLSWTTEKRKIKDLIPAQYNPRQMTETQAKDLRKSIEKFDIVEIPAVNTDGTILAGHQRLHILGLMGRGEEEIDVRVPSRELTELEAQEYNLRSNKNTGEWDLDKLFAMPEGLLKEVGWSDKEIQKLIDGHTEATEDDYDVDKGLQSPVRVEKGEIWQLGTHRLMCGDSTVKSDVERLMDGRQADMVFTDPPYGMGLKPVKNYASRKENKKREEYEPIIGDQEKFKASRMFELIESPVWYIWGADYFFDTIPRFFEGSIIVWAKRMTEEESEKVFGSAFELCWTYPKQKKVLWFERAINQSSEALSEHPTQKPTALTKRALAKSCKNGGIVVDLFGGSGSTLIACEQTGRTCYGMEIDPRYCTVILDRWEKFTGKKAEKVA